MGLLGSAEIDQMKFFRRLHHVSLPFGAVLVRSSLPDFLNDINHNTNLSIMFEASCSITLEVLTM